MKSRDDSVRSDRDIQEVVSLYREVRAGQSPARLDRSILKQAAANTASQQKLSTAWLRPLAFAASFGICVALVLEINDFQISTETAHRVMEDGASASEADGPRNSSGNDVNDQTFQGAADSVLQDLESVDAAAKATLKEMPGSTTETAARACTNSQRSTAGSWWQCIETLRREGFRTEADIELRSLRRQFPDSERAH